MTALVVDASIVVRIAASESDVPGELVSLLMTGELHAPVYIGVEIDSAFRGLERSGQLSDPRLAGARAFARALPVELWEWTLLEKRAWDLRHNLTTYDAGYVALAERIDAVLLTGDRRLAKAPGIRCPVEVL